MGEMLKVGSVPACGNGQLQLHQGCEMLAEAL